MAVSVFVPAVLKVSEHLPEVAVPVQLTAPSLMVTFPVGMPAVEVTEELTLTACPTEEGLGVWEVMVVVVAALSTSMVTSWLALGDTPLLAVMVKVYVPAAVSVPDIAPLLDWRVSPGGRLPEASWNQGAGNPGAENVWLMAVPYVSGLAGGVLVKKCLNKSTRMTRCWMQSRN